MTDAATDGVHGEGRLVHSVGLRYDASGWTVRGAGLGLAGGGDNC